MYELNDVDDVNQKVTKRLIAESVTIPSVRRSNMGGWHSPNLGGRQEACFRDLFQQIRARVRETLETISQELKQPLPNMRIGMHAWAMVMRHGDYTIPHDHADAHWATVYYPDAGNADEQAHPESGLLALQDVRQGGRPMPGLDLSGTFFVVRPRTGRLVVFPGFLLHYVHAYQGQRPRVSISCNLIMEPVMPVANERQVVTLSSEKTVAIAKS
jgi:uncharacterized protein (TIGR02466 family)